MTEDASQPPAPRARRASAFSPEVDALIREIDALGAHQELWRYLYRNRRDTPLDVLEHDLRAMKARLVQRNPGSPEGAKPL
jgi:hypothetical protein